MQPTVVNAPVTVVPSRSRREQWSARVCGGLLALAGWLGTAGPATAQNVVPPPESVDYTMPFPDASGSAGFVQNEPQIVGGTGVRGRIVHEAGSTVGRQDSVTSFDIAPYVFLDENWVVFNEDRLFVANNGRVGGTALVGGRRYLPLLDTVVGGGAAWDGDDHRGVMFQQWSIFGEILSEWVDVRFNAYFPYGEETKIISETFAPGTAVFVNRPGGLPGTNIAFQRLLDSATVMEGQDMMFAFPIPGEFAQNMNLEASVGWYHFVADDPVVPEAWGWRLRFDADIWNRLSHMFLEINDDEVFDTNVVFGIDINYWHKQEHRPRLGHSQHQRLADWVRRNRSMTAFTEAILAPPELAINPDTGAPYIALQVNSAAGGGGNGRLGTEFDTIQNAINFSAGMADFGTRDIIFVQGGSDFAGAAANVDMTLAADPLQILGEGPILSLDVANIAGGITVPGVTLGAQPILRNTVGPAVIMSSGSRFAGFTISNIAGTGILANGQSNFLIEEVDINTTTAGGHGIQIINGGGTIGIDDVTITNTAGDAFNVLGGNAAIRWLNTNAITNDEGFSVFILDAAGSVDMRSVTINDTGGQGIAVLGTVPGASTAQVTFSTINLLNTNGGAASEAILIENHAGSVSFLDPVVIDGNNGDNLVVRNLGAVGSVSFLDTLTINNRNAHGILVDTIFEAAPNAGTVVFNSAVDINAPVAGLGLEEAVQFQSASGTLLFNSTLDIDGSNGNGIEISNIANTGTTTGQFLANDLITIENVAGTSFNVDNVAKTAFRVTTNGLTINNRNGAGAVGINVSNNALSAVNSQVAFNLTTLIENELDSTASAITVLNNTGPVGFGTVNINDALGLGPGSFVVRVFNNNNPAANVVASVGFDTLNVGEDDEDEGANLATVVSFENNERVSVNRGTINSTNGRAIEILTNILHNVNFTEVNATNADFGILVLDSPGEFSVSGTGNATGSGGEISGMTVAGAAFINTNEVDLGFMDFDTNFTGVIGDTILFEEDAATGTGGFDPHMALQGVRITNSAAEGLLLTDVSDFSLTDSLLQNNGRGVIPAQEQIDFLATISEADLDNDGDDEFVTYNITIDNSSVIDPNTVAAVLTTDMIFIRTDAAIADPVTLNLTFTDNGDPPTLSNSITSNRNGQAAVNVDWEGNVNAVFSNNEFQLLNGNGAVNGDDQVGIQLDIDGIANVVVSNNRMFASGDDATGLLFNFDQRANVQILNNFETDAGGNLLPNSGFSFDGENSTAFDLNFNAANNTLVIRNNLIVFQNGAFESDGILIRRIFAPSNVTIEGNSLNFLTQAGGVTQRGIVFQDVRGIINLFGATDNFVGTATGIFGNLNPFVYIGGGANGTISVNGVRVP